MEPPLIFSPQEGVQEKEVIGLVLKDFKYIRIYIQRFEYYNIWTFQYLHILIVKYSNFSFQYPIFNKVWITKNVNLE